MKKINLLLVLIIALAIIPAMAQKKPRLLFENNAEGKAVSGSLNDLIQAIRDGEIIQVYFFIGDKPADYVEHTARVKFATIMNSPTGQFVFGQLDPIVGQIPDFEKNEILLKENLEWSVILSTNGKNDQMTVNTITGQVLNHSVFRWGTKWFKVE